MKDVVDKCSTKGCAIDVGSIIDNEDCVWRVEKNFASREEAESTIAAVRERALAAAPASEPPPVWPDPHGTRRGMTLHPLYPSVPEAARRNPALYELLALFDAVRAGSPRERALALPLIEERLQS